MSLPGPRKTLTIGYIVQAGMGAGVVEEVSNRSPTRLKRRVCPESGEGTLTMYPVRHWWEVRRKLSYHKYNTAALRCTSGELIAATMRT